MFSLSLRKRPDWASVPNLLLSQQVPKWTESELDNHDISVPMPAAHNNREQIFFQLILLSAKEFQTTGDDALQRIERLFHQHGGRHVGIVFLLTPIHAGTVALMNLQLSLMSKTEMPILPLSNLTSLTTTLTVFQRQMVSSTRSASSITKINPASALLPYCTTDPPLPEHARKILTDICPNIAGLAQAATTTDGKQALQEYLSRLPSTTTGLSLVESITSFWEQEFAVD